MITCIIFAYGCDFRDDLDGFIIVNLGAASHSHHATVEAHAIEKLIHKMP
jgi:hypothetical protein